MERKGGGNGGRNSEKMKLSEKRENGIKEGKDGKKSLRY